jgi:hypothetical protein
MAPFNKIKYSGNFYPINYSLEMGNEKSFGPPVHRMDEHRVEITFAAGSPAKTTVTLGCCLVNPLTWYYGMNQFRYVYGGDLQRLLTEDEWRLIWDECRKKVDDNLLTRIAETAAAKPAPAKKSKFPGLCLWKT